MGAKIIKTTGKERNIKPANGTDFTLWELQEAVGGYVEFIHLEDHRTMVVDEDGRIKGKPVNLAATKLCGRTIVGDVLVCDKSQIK